MRESSSGSLDKQWHHIPQTQYHWSLSISHIAYKRCWRAASSTIWYKCVWAISLSRSDKQTQIVSLKHTRRLKTSKMKKGGGCFSKSLIAQPVMTTAVTPHSSVMIPDLKHPRPASAIKQKAFQALLYTGSIFQGSCKETETHLLLRKA